MKSLLLIFTLMFLISCQKELTKPNTDLAALSTTSSSVIISNGLYKDTLNFSFQHYVCDGQLVTFTGSIYITLEDVSNGFPLAGSLLYRYHFSGVAPNGNKYLALEVDQTTYNYVAIGAYEARWSFSGSYIKQGGGGGGIIKFNVIGNYDSVTGISTFKLIDYNLIC